MFFQNPCCFWCERTVNQVFFFFMDHLSHWVILHLYRNNAYNFIATSSLKLDQLWVWVVSYRNDHWPPSPLLSYLCCRCFLLILEHAAVFPLFSETPTPSHDRHGPTPPNPLHPSIICWKQVNSEHTASWERSETQSRPALTMEEEKKKQVQNDQFNIFWLYSCVKCSFRRSKLCFESSTFRLDSCTLVRLTLSDS